eukprot:scaffold205972_cov32-Tisochrysis_lutea.AAC.2
MRTSTDEPTGRPSGRYGEVCGVTSDTSRISTLLDAYTKWATRPRASLTMPSSSFERLRPLPPAGPSAASAVPSGSASPSEPSSGSSRYSTAPRVLGL